MKGRIKGQIEDRKSSIPMCRQRGNALVFSKFERANKRANRNSQTIVIYPIYEDCGYTVVLNGTQDVNSPFPFSTLSLIFARTQTLLIHHIMNTHTLPHIAGGDHISANPSMMRSECFIPLSSNAMPLIFSHILRKNLSHKRIIRFVLRLGRRIITESDSALIDAAALLFQQNAAIVQI